MPCLISDLGFCRHDLENEACSSRPRLLHGDFALVPLPHTHRGRTNRSLAQHISDDTTLETQCALQHRSFHSRVEDAAVIDRNGPFIHTSGAPRCRCRGHTHLCDDYLDAPDIGRRFPYTYPLQCMEPGGVRWSTDQIHAYNRDVLRHNAQIARRRDDGVSGEYMMLHPVMDPHGRFPPGFDRPLRAQDFLSMDELHLDTQRQHYNLPMPETPHHLHLLNSTEHHLRHTLKQLQLLQLHGATHLAEQLLLQLLAIQQQQQHALAAPPRSLGSGLPPEFDIPLLQQCGGGTPPFGYGDGGNAMALWNQELLARLRLGRGIGGPCAVAAVGDDAPCNRAARYPAIDVGDRAYGFAGGWPGSLGVGASGYEAYGLGMSGGGGGGGPSDLSPFMARIACEGGRGRGRRYGSFN